MLQPGEAAVRQFVLEAVMGWAFVTGADGTVGRHLVPMLVNAGVPVRAGVHREEDPLTTYRDPDIERVYIDFEEPLTLRNALQDVEVIYLVTPQIPQSVHHVRAVVAVARELGVQRIVRQSVFNAETGRDGEARWHRQAEQAIRESGLAATFLRPNSFMQNFVTVYRDDIVARGFFRLPLGSARVSSVDVRDVAAAATAAIMDDEFVQPSYTLTGETALSGHDMARVLSEVTGRLIEYRDEYEDGGRVPHDETDRVTIEALRELGEALRRGEMAGVTGDVERLTRRRPITFERFAQDYGWAFVAATGRRQDETAA
jgi:uncharacterized protein YbjT (DUF2867 family)